MVRQQVMVRLRILFLARPAVVLLLAPYTAIGHTQAAGVDRPDLLVPSLVVVGYLLFSVAVNDIADVAVDRVNLPGNKGRPLAFGLCSPRETIVIAGVAAVVAVAGAAVLL